MDDARTPWGGLGLAAVEERRLLDELSNGGTTSTYATAIGVETVRRVVREEVVAAIREEFDRREILAAYHRLTGVDDATP